MPNTSWNFLPTASTALGTTIPLSASGNFDLRVISGTNIDVVVDVLGYFTATDSNSAAFTHAATRVYDTRVAPLTTIPGNTTRTIDIAGMSGIPAAGSGLGAVAMSVIAIHPSGTTPGFLRVWTAGQPEPGSSMVQYPGSTGAIRNSFVVAAPSPDGKINIKNVGSDPVHIVLDVQGWYANVMKPIQNGQVATARTVTLQAASAGADWASYRYRLGITGAFTDVPVADVTAKGGGAGPTSWPIGKTGSGEFPEYVWDLVGTVGEIDDVVQIQACYGVAANDPDPVCSMPSNMLVGVSGFQGGYATSEVGPGEVSLATGDFQVSAIDVAEGSMLGGLGLSRTHTTRPVQEGTPGTAGIFGPGWTASFEGADLGASAWQIRSTDSGMLVFTQSDGGLVTFQASTPVGSYPVEYAAIGSTELLGATATWESAGRISVVDPQGTTVTWDLTGSTWQVVSSVQAGSNTSATYAYDGSGRPVRMLGAAPDGVSCTNPSSTPGCRSLTFDYTTVTVGGVTESRLAGVNLVAADPTTQAMQTIPVAAYSYNSAGQLHQAWDPRITPNLKVTYTYDSAGRLATITEPGLAGWTLTYDSEGRLSTASRPSSAGTATETVVYDVPTTGTGAPIDLDESVTAAWGQTTHEVPATGTAVFRADHVPASTNPASIVPDSFRWATIEYLDVNGRTVNTAEYGAGAWQWDYKRYNANGSVWWTLSAQNRAEALSPTSISPAFVHAETTSQARAQLLQSTVIYNSLKPELVEATYGPSRMVAIDGGGSHPGRDFTWNIYDQGAPSGEKPGLVTTEITGTWSDTIGIDYDRETVRIGYEPVVSGDPSGWTLKQPTTKTIEMPTGGSANLITATRYDSKGRAVEERTPGSAGTADARTLLTTFYTATGTGDCVNPALAGMVCKTEPGAQPTAGEPLATTTFTYDIYGQNLTTTETVPSSGGTVTRVTAATYDSAGRQLTESVTVTPTAAGGTAVPTVTIGYDSATGLETTRTAGGQTLTTTYDNNGRVIAYTDANGTVTTTTYDLAGRISTENSGKGTTSFTYDSSTERRGKVTSLTNPAGTFTAVYNNAGNLVIQTYPGGLEARYGYDTSETRIAVEYRKSSTSWYSQSIETDGRQQILRQQDDFSQQTYEFDPAGRLTTAMDTVATGPSTTACTTRVYSFDKDSNRTQVATHGPGTAGVCSTSTSPTTRTSSFDEASRLWDTGYAYDELGRTITVPSADAVGTGSKNAITGNLTIGYYANDMVASQAQGTATRTFTLDPTGERIASISDGTTTTTNHFADDSDSPAWTGTGTNWVAYFGSVDGDFAASVDDTGVIGLKVVNLHGDIVATVAPSDTALGAVQRTDEYGVSTNPAAADDSFGWLGENLRSTDALGGLVIMGVRLYNPSTGRFLSIDPVRGGNDNPYTYPLDPINKMDTTGKFWGLIAKAGKWLGGHVAKGAKWAGGHVAAGAKWAGGKVVAGAKWAGGKVATGAKWVAKTTASAYRSAGSTVKACAYSAVVGYWMGGTTSAVGGCLIAVYAKHAK